MANCTFDILTPVSDCPTGFAYDATYVLDR